jgi:nucleoid-associated protein YgaU
MSNFNTIGHVWTSSDKFYNLAAEYYSDPEMWWVIAFYNQKPTEFHLSPGDIVYIPTPLETVLYYIGY